MLIHVGELVLRVLVVFVHIGTHDFARLQGCDLEPREYDALALWQLVLAEAEYTVRLGWLQEVLRPAILEIMLQLFFRHAELGAAVPEKAAANVGLHLAFQ